MESKVNTILKQVRDDKKKRDKNYIYFRNSNLAQYTREGRKQFIGFNEKPDWKEEYQYNVFDPITRDKVMAVISKTRGLYEAQFFSKNKLQSEQSEVITNTCKAFYKDSSAKLKEKTKNRHIMIQALITPKSIWFEGWKYQKRKIKDIVERDEKGKITKTKDKEIVHYNGPYGELIPVEDFIPGSMTERDIQEQPHVSWITVMSRGKFKRDFSRFNTDVPNSGELINGDNSDMLIRDDLESNDVEVIRYFDKWEDEFHIIANGVLLTKENSPMPFVHKDYPFTWGGFEELNPHFIYDMPLTIKLMDMQDTDNEILNLSLDMLWRALNEVVLVSGGDNLNADVLYGGGMVEVNDPSNFNKLQFGSTGVFNASQNITQQIKQSLESSSVSSELAGQSGQGREKTAREVLVAREAAMEIASLFLDTMEEMERGKAYLRVKNQLDRYQRPIEWEKRLGKKQAGKSIPVFRSLSIKDTSLSGGKRGLLNINITNKPRSAEELNIENRKIKEISQIIELTPEFIRDIDFDVEIVGNSSVKQSKAIKIDAAERFFANAMKVPQVLNVRKAAEDYVKELDKDPQEALQPEQQQQQGVAGGLGEIKSNKNKQELNIEI